MKNLITLMIVLITVYFIYKKVSTRYNPSESKTITTNTQVQDSQKCPPGFVWNRYTGCTGENEPQAKC